ncbi:hypothetical protein ACFQV2_14755 [Actinokineospora soli]|uniref:Uncharacterized protein n=1 Tax=Actinokineospora soli TaxID=1048753 RepID=A0ABW2TLG4_9PSEU
MSADPGFSPYALFRRGTLEAPALAGLVPVRTWDLLAAAERAKADRDALGARLEEAMHEAVPELAAEHRRAVLKIRRDVHNDRLPADTTAARVLPEPCRDLLERWVRARAEGEELLSLAHAVYAEEVESARKTLAEVARGEDFQRGVQLSGEEVYREVMAYAADPFDTKRKPSKRRRAESTIVSFAYRVVFKPSPFGSFTEIGAQPWSAEPADGPRVGQSRLSVGLLAWMAHQLHRVDGADDLVRVRLNNSSPSAATGRCGCAGRWRARTTASSRTASSAPSTPTSSGCWPSCSATASGRSATCASAWSPPGWPRRRPSRPSTSS